MSFKFDSSQQFQLDAIKAITDLFIGQPTGSSGKTASINLHSPGAFTEVTNEAGVYGNNLKLNDDALLENLRTVQANNGLPGMAVSLDQRYFSTEMETGTGKTYVYLRTMMELFLQYGFSKFVLVVPSVAIREGVKASVGMINPHFKDIYDGNVINYTEYNSKNLSAVRSFATNNQLELLILNIDSFNKDTNKIKEERDEMHGETALSLIQHCNPIVIIDEPQKLGSEIARKSIGDLNPMCELTYSATHKQPLNLVYRLDPVQAHEQGLVKTIVVSEIAGKDDLNKVHIRFVDASNKKGKFSGKLEIHKFNESKSETETRSVAIKTQSDLEELSGGLEKYRGWIVEDIDLTEPSISFRNGEKVTPTDAKDESKEDIVRVQIRTAIKEYGLQADRLKDLNIKPIALFFIDHVANYREYLDDGEQLGLYGRIFEEEMKIWLGDRTSEEVFGAPVEQLHDGYFARDKKTKMWKDSKESKGSETGAKTKDDIDAYNLIMRDKEKLIQFSTPLRFIFSHSTLQEGWDNPNVFVICTLRESASDINRRQTIGRGLRLPVNQDGVRVREAEHRLSVIANESYEMFSRKLQSEYEKVGFIFGKVLPTSFARMLAPEKIALASAEDTLGADNSQKIFDHLVDKKMLDLDGSITDRFQPNDVNFLLPVPEEFEGIRDALQIVIRGLLPENHIRTSKNRQRIKGNKEVVSENNDYFIALWEKIKHKTKYKVKFSTDEVVKSCIDRIKKANDDGWGKVKKTEIEVRRTRTKFEQKGITGVGEREYIEDVEHSYSIMPDILTTLQSRTDLTRSTIFRIINESVYIGDFLVNPSKALDVFSRAISIALKELLVEGIVYTKIGDVYDMELFNVNDKDNELERDISKLYEVQNVEKTPYDFVEYDSETEKNIARFLDGHEQVKFYMKLPKWFKIETPVGTYNPDWAYVIDNDQKVYLVRESKSTLDSSERRTDENLKIDCGKAHFKAIDVDFGVVAGVDGLLKV